jgi:hypothetical protein
MNAVIADEANRDLGMVKVIGLFYAMPVVVL